MNAILKVTPEKLAQTAQEFSNTENNIRTITGEMISIVDGFKSIWQGEAATGFANRFASLTEDMNRLYAMIRKHSEDLTQMAEEYALAESDSENLAGSLTAGGI